MFFFKENETHFPSPYRLTRRYQSEPERKEIKCKFRQFVLRMVEMYDRDIVFMYFDGTKPEKGRREKQIRD